MKLIVTAGGQGTKLWPYSRTNKPKQFQQIVGEESLYQYTIDTLLKSYSANDIFISTKEKYLKIAKEQSPQVPDENYILEPNYAKDRGPGEGYAFLHLSIKHPDEPFMIIQSDVMRTPPEKFLDMIKDAETLVKRDKKFITAGNKANYPILGIDYMRLEKPVSIEGDSELEVFEIEEFIPRLKDYYKTKELVENFHITTHANHTCWFPNLILDAYKQHRPDWHKSLMQIKDLIGKRGAQNDIDKIYEQMEKGSTEEVTKHVFPGSHLILLPFKWTDVGTWDSVYEFCQTKGEIYTDGNVIALDSKNSLVKSSTKDKLVAVCGLDNMVVVDTEDVLLVLPKDKAGDVKNILDQIKKTKELNKHL